MKKLYRSKDAMICGVCGGIAEYLGVDKTIVRVVYAAVTAFTAFVPGTVLYVACMFIIPEDNDIIDN